MNIDWFYFRIISSSLLLFFLLLSLFLRLFDSFKLKNDLKKIKNWEVSRIVGRKNIDLVEQYDSQLLDFKKEIDLLMKDVYFDSYDKTLDNDRRTSEMDFTIDFEESLDKLLDGKILDIIKEKDILLKQKDSLITSLEEKNRIILKTLINKAFYLLLEKDKIIKEKNTILNSLKNKLQEVNSDINISYISPYSPASNEAPVNNDLPKKNTNHEFINVNH